MGGRFGVCANIGRVKSTAATTIVRLNAAPPAGGAALRRTIVVAAVLFTLPIFAQTPKRPPIRTMPNQQANFAESAVKNAMERLADDKKIYDRDLDVLQHIRAADDALADVMQ